MFLGCFTTLCVPETKRKTLEQLAGEEEGNVQIMERRGGDGASFRGKGDVVEDTASL